MDTSVREPSGQDAKVATPLQKKIIYAIADGIPLNLICHRCEYEMPFECVIDPDSRHDKEGWIRLAARIIKIVKEDSNENQPGE